MEAIILAGGLGTRLRSEVDDIPKSMAPIGSRPFLEYQIDHFISRGIDRFILSVGYKSDSIRNHFGDQYRDCEIVYALEETPLGTGGAIKNAMRFVLDDHVIIANGDSLFLADIRKQYKFHMENQADATLALKPMTNIDRYGTVEIINNKRIKGFLEKQSIQQGLINGGIYIFNVDTFNGLNLPEKFSIEKDFFEILVNQFQFLGFVSESYFLDIGIPEDFMKAQYEIGLFPKIDKSWTLFLDRDGVINEKRDNDYIKSLSEFNIFPGIPESIAGLSRIFGRIIIVTNQQGIGKGLMTEEDLNQIHSCLQEKIWQKGGDVDAIYHAPNLEEEDSPMRKPGIGMAIKAQKDFPEIDFSKSIIAGDSKLDIEFGRKAGMITVLIGNEENSSQAYNIKSLNEFKDLLSSLTYHCHS